MPEVKSVQVNVSVEPTLARLLRENEENVSQYVRMLIIKDLMARNLLNLDNLMALVH